MNGDGRADIVGFGQSGVSVSLGKTDGTFAPHKTAYSNTFAEGKGGWSSQDKYPRQLADVNGDGRADIVGFANDGVYVSLANG
ncbi:VCBS repeat-containing protein [Okeania sp.]|uniref:FG-GAP repeat domain-containing protein n=1 Tax=Okeania sp. TaxID=3100323 RepID=UPI002B4AC67E|nr:VCBS repeat-containing protein [Okeania sp.]MEB3340761.1 VCBS repeat-containing protein [Okeania sp.]